MSIISHLGAKVIGISGSLIWSKPLMELIFISCGEFRWSTEVPVSQIHSPHLNDRDPGIFSDLLRSIQMIKRECDAESNGNIPQIFISSKAANPDTKAAVVPKGRSSTANLSGPYMDNIIAQYLRLRNNIGRL